MSDQPSTMINESLEASCSLPASSSESVVSSLPAASCQLPAFPHWYVLWTKSQCEQQVHDQLAARGFDPFLPMMDVWSRRNGIRRHVTVPMFPGYLLLRHQMDMDSYIEVRKARGLVKVLGDGWDRLAVVPDREIEAIQKVHNAHAPVLPHPYLKEGQRVRLTGGILAGAEGILLRTKANKGLLVLSIELLQRSVAVQIDATFVEPA